MEKNQAASAGDARDTGLIPGSGRSPGEGNGNSFQYSCLEKPMDRGAWWATVHQIARVGQDLATEYTPVDVAKCYEYKKIRAASEAQNPVSL